MNTLVIAEIAEGQLRKSTLSAVTFAKQTGGSFSILVLGPGAKGAAASLTGLGAQKILASEDATFAQPLAERYAPTVAQVAKTGFDVVAVTASSGSAKIFCVSSTIFCSSLV